MNGKVLLLLLVTGCARSTSMTAGSGGTSATGGTTATGGSSATGGSTGTGGMTTAADAGSCPPECLRAVRCVTACGGTPVSLGCCPCTPPAFDDISCPRPAAFESFRYTTGSGPCPPNSDCSSMSELLANGTFRHDCDGQLPVVVHETMVSAADRDAAIAVLTDPALVSLLDLGKSPCQPPTDIFEAMTLTAGGRQHTNSVTFCRDAPIEAARRALQKLLEKYLVSRCPMR